MKETGNIFEQEIEVPEVVIRKRDQAFCSIKKESKSGMNEEKELSIIEINERGQEKNTDKAKCEKRRKAFFKTPFAAAICIGLIAIGGISTYAAVRYHWGRGMQGSLQSTEVQQEQLETEGMATVYSNELDYSNLAVTAEGITVMPDVVVADERFAYISLKVSGYDLAEGKEPCFEWLNVYTGDVPSDDNWLQYSASFYNGIVCGEDGRGIYDDGSEIDMNENGSIVERYVDENGNLDYVIVAMVSGFEDSLLGQTLHVELRNLGTVFKTDYTDDIRAEWNFDFELPQTTNANHIEVGREVEGMPFVVDSIDLSPVSIKINYSVVGDEIPDTPRIEGKVIPNDVPLFNGVVLKDGSRLFLADGGMNGYTDETWRYAYEISAFDRVIDPNEVAAILIEEIDSGKEPVAVLIGE